MLDRVFQSMTGSNEYLGEFTTEIREIGTLHLPSGKIVCCDPLVFPEAEPFEQTVPPGRYPVALHLVHLAPDHMRVGYAILRFKDQLSASWRMATVEGQDLSSLEEDEIFGYGVDAGTGCFMDHEAAKKLDQLMQENSYYYDDFIAPVYDEWTDIQLNEQGLNTILFHSGWGDGFYPSYWGLDEKGEPVCLVTDFGVLDEPDEEEEEDSE